VQSLQMKWSSLWGPMQSEVVRHLLTFGVVSMVASCLTPLAQLQIREGIVQALGSHTAGIWEGAQRLSASYSLVLTSLVGVYFLPRFSRCRDGASLFAEMRKAIFLLVPISIGMGLVLYQWRSLAIDMLFNHAFQPMGEMMAVQCVGDTLRIVAWVFAYVMLARRKHLRYLTAEVVFSVVHVVLASTLQSTQGLQGLAMAYTVSCAIYVAMAWPAIFKLRGQVSSCPC
jgi:O-antigen/teichoic acid export membrane protein